MSNVKAIGFREKIDRNKIEILDKVNKTYGIIQKPYSIYSPYTKEIIHVKELELINNLFNVSGIIFEQHQTIILYQKR